MREQIKVIFDTNAVRAEMSAPVFFGRRSELEKFGAVAEIIIPDMVIDEIKVQKKITLISKRDEFADNPFHAILKLKKTETKDFNIEKYVTDLLQDESIKHTVISLTQPDALLKIKELCHKRIAPFESSGDKGFKDAYIYLTILEYMEGITDEQVFFVTKDARFKEAFEGIRKITVIENFQEFEKFNISSFKEEYFINKLKEEVSDKITSDSIFEVSTNIEDNWILKVNDGGLVVYVLVDFSSREIISFTNDFSGYISKLSIAGNFQTVHDTVAELEPYRSFFSDKDILQLFNAAISNNQIYQIATDEDVRAFFMELYSIRKYLLDTEAQEAFEAYFQNQPYERR